MMNSQIERLATFIMDEIPGEPSRSEGAVDTAIRLLKRAYVPSSLKKREGNETLGMVVEDDCTIGELRNNRFGPEFEAALKKMWEHRGFPKEAPLDKASQYVKGQMNGFLIGFVAAWEFLHDEVE